MDINGNRYSYSGFCELMYNYFEHLADICPTEYFIVDFKYSQFKKILVDSDFKFPLIEYFFEKYMLILHFYRENVLQSVFQNSF
jgi:hypothetical protein